MPIWQAVRLEDRPSEAGRNRRAGSGGTKGPGPRAGDRRPAREVRDGAGAGEGPCPRPVQDDRTDLLHLRCSSNVRFRSNHTMDNLRWGILGAGKFAGTFAKGIAASRTGTLVAIGSRSQETADRFGDEYGVPRRHASYDALVADPEVDVVHIS